MSGIEKALPIIGGISDSLNPLFGHLTNVKNRKFTREMYARQREDALADWAMQNEYNSPRAQMQRFQEAGLNPALIYGQMSDASPVRQSSSSGGQASAPQSDASGSLSKIYDMRRTSAQTDLVAKQMSVMDKQIENIAAQTVKTLSEVDLTNLNVSRGQVQAALEKQLAPLQLQGMDIKNRQMETEIFTSLSANERSNYLAAQSLQKGVEEILSMRLGRSYTKALIANLGLDAKLKQYEIGLNAKGIQKNDSVVLRSVIPMMNQLSALMSRLSGRTKMTPEEQKEVDKILEGIFY